MASSSRPPTRTSGAAGPKSARAGYTDDEAGPTREKSPDEGG